MTAVTISTSYQLQYTNKQAIPIPLVIESLRGLEGVIERTPRVMEGLLGDVSIKDVQVYVQHIYAGSLVEDLIIDIVFGGEEDYKRFREAIRKFRKQGFESLEDMEQAVLKRVVGFAIAALLGAGATWLAMKDGQSNVQVEAYNNTIINFGAGEFALTGNEVRAIIESSVPDKKSLVRDVVGVVRPAKAEEGAKIKFAELEDLNMDSSVIAEIPSKYDEPQQEEKTQNYSNVDLVIFASDRDKRRQGWAGLVDGIVDERTRLTLDPAIEPHKLHGRLRAKADVTIISKYNLERRKYVPSEILVRKVD